MGAKLRGYKMPTAHIKELEAIKEKKKTLQEKENKIKSEIMFELSTSLIEANALEVNYDVLIGGILEVIEKSTRGDKITEAWKLSGEKFRQRKKKGNAKKNPSSPKKDEKSKTDDQ